MRNSVRKNDEVRTIEINQQPISEVLGACQVTLGKTNVLAVVEESEKWEFAFQKESFAHLTTADESAVNYLQSQVESWLIDSFPPLKMTFLVLQSAGGVFTAGTIALNTALRLSYLKLVQQHRMSESTLSSVVGLVAGIVDDELRIDLDAHETKHARCVMSLAMSGEQILSLHVDGQCTMDDFNDLLAALTHQIHRLNEALPALKLSEFAKADNEREIVIATKNPAKAREFKAMFEQEGYQVKTLIDYPDLPDVEETGKTFTENAILKAETISQLLQRPVLGDDSGLCVDALNGMPGIYSARYAGDHDNAANNAKLLSEMAGVPEFERTAHYHTSLVFAAPGKENLVVEGEVEGLIAGIPRGENGFGYDPLFYLPELDKTMAEISPEQKNKISHRAVATAKLKKVWRDWLEG